MKVYQKESVYEAAVMRIERLFEEFGTLLVAFSGGKDSGVMLNLVLEVAERLGRLGSVVVYHLDYEAQYRYTTEYVERVFAGLPTEVRRYWFCVPIKAQCCTSMFQSYWQPWRPEDEGKWVRDLPQEPYVYHAGYFPFDFDYEVDDYRFSDRFARALSAELGKPLCVLVGIRSQESLHRYKAVKKDVEASSYRGISYTTVVSKQVVNAYPIYDWTVEDIWIANGRFGYDYNRLYDIFHQAGVPLNAMRVASPFNDAAPASLNLYKSIDPDNWGRMVGRVNGVNFTAIYGGTTAMGWNKIKKPDHFTWKQYMNFLLATLPEEVRAMYERKLAVSIEYWTKKGGALPVEIARQLPEAIKHEKLGRPTNKRHYKRPYEVVRFSEYLDEIEIENPNLLPTYKRMCIAIMKNDTSCKTLGFGQTKDELARRKKIMDKYKNL